MGRKNLMIVAVIIVIAVGYFTGKSKEADNVTTRGATEKEITSAFNITTHVDPSSLNPSQVESNQAELPVEPKPLFSGPLHAFKEKFGEPESKYIDSISYSHDGLLIDSDYVSGMVSSISMSFSHDTFLNKENALTKILSYLPEDAKKIKSRVDGNYITVLYQSPSTATTFSEWYEAWGSEALKEHGAGMILVKVIGGDPDSKERLGNVTIARMYLCNLSRDDIKDLGLNW